MRSARCADLPERQNVASISPHCKIAVGNNGRRGPGRCPSTAAALCPSPLLWRLGRQPPGRTGHAKLHSGFIHAHHKEALAGAVSSRRRGRRPQLLARGLSSLPSVADLPPRCSWQVPLDRGEAAGGAAARPRLSAAQAATAASSDLPFQQRRPAARACEQHTTPALPLGTALQDVTLPVFFLMPLHVHRSLPGTVPFALPTAACLLAGQALASPTIRTEASALACPSRCAWCAVPVTVGRGADREDFGRPRLPLSPHRL